MTNSMAKSSILKLRDQGKLVTDDDVVALHELASSMSKDAIIAQAVNAPRVAWAGDIAIHEPTQQSDWWLDIYARHFFDARRGLLDKMSGFLFGRGLQALAYARAYSLCHARTPGAFNALTERKAAVDAVGKWVSSLTCTDAELMGACMYASFGESIPSVEYPPLSEARSRLDGVKKQEKEYNTLVDSAISSGIGLPIEDIKALASSELYRIIRKYTESKAAESIFGRRSPADLAEQVKNARFQEYIMLIKVISERTPAT
jgi:hypothetical protein